MKTEETEIQTEETGQLKMQLNKAKDETRQLQIQTELAREESKQFHMQIQEAKEEIEKMKMQAETERTEREGNLRTQLQKMRLEYEITIEQIKQEQTRKYTYDTTIHANTPELPTFNDETDNMDSYLARFERFATIYKWNKQDWAILLSALLTGRALEAYARLSEDDATDYRKIKAALLKRYNLTEEGFRRKFRESRPNHNENPKQFATRLGHYLNRWLEMADVTDYENMKTLIIKEQFLDACPRNVAIHLKEKLFVNMKEMCDQAERYTQAHSQNFATCVPSPLEEIKSSETDTITDNIQRKQCFNCGKLGHIRAACRNEGGGNEQRCTKCNRFGHKTEMCRSTSEFGGMLRTKRTTQKSKRSANSHINTQRHIKQTQADTKNVLKPIKGKLNGQLVNTLRDSGCSTICVNKKLVLPEQRTGIYRKCKLMDGTQKEFEIARVNIDTPYIKQERVPVMCVKDLEFDIVIGDVTGARCKCNPNLNWRPNDKDRQTQYSRMQSFDNKSRYGHSRTGTLYH